MVGNPIDRHGSAFGLLPDILVLRCSGTGEVMARIPLAETRQAGSVKLTRAVAMQDLLCSFGNQHPGQLVLNNYPRFMQALSMPGTPCSISAPWTSCAPASGVSRATTSCAASSA